jgi:riboflavin synthase
MFTGIIEAVGRVVSVVNSAGARRITVEAGSLAGALRTGDSIAVSGVCLTALDITESSFVADLALETWTRTSLSRLKPGSRVNLELPMRADGRFGGHIVQGHVDGAGKLISLKQLSGGEDYWLEIEIPPDLARYVIFKGSLSIEGISLTVAQIEGSKVGVAIIPHTLEATNLKSLQPGDPVNLEVDMLAKYAEKMLGERASGSSLALEDFVRRGF